MQTLLALAVGNSVGASGMNAAHHPTDGESVKVTQLSQRGIIEKLDGRDARATASGLLGVAPSSSHVAKLTSMEVLGLWCSRDRLEMLSPELASPGMNTPNDRKLLGRHRITKADELAVWYVVE